MRGGVIEMRVNRGGRPTHRGVMTPHATTGRRVGSLTMAVGAKVADAIRSFVDTEYPRVVATVGAATGQPDAAEDAVQEALLKVLAEGHRPDRIAAWVTVVAINEVRGRQRRAGAEKRATDRMDHSSAADPAGGVADRVTVLEAIGALPEGQRIAVLLHYYLDSSVADIAAALGVAEGTVKTHLHRGRAALAEALGEST
jgi:RNA polymerase sigma-70 factor, ECF subfamily